MRADVKAFLESMNANPRPAFDDNLIAMIRKMPPDSMPSMDVPVGELAVNRTIMLPRAGADIALRLFDTRQAREPGPVVIYFHGGGFVVGSVDLFAALSAEIARRLDLPVISVEYRLAPEHPWPAAPDDAEATARWVANNGAAFGRQFTGLVLAGDSAGGNLSAVTSLALKDKPAALPVIMQVLIYPKVDHSVVHPSERLFGDGYGLPSADMKYYFQAYKADAMNWRASPLLADQADMPPTLLVTAGLDPLRDEGRAYAAKLINAGVPVTYREYPGTIHGFCSFRKMIPSALTDTAELLDVAAAMLREIQARR